MPLKKCKKSKVREIRKKKYLKTSAKKTEVLQVFIKKIMDNKSNSSCQGSSAAGTCTQTTDESDGIEGAAASAAATSISADNFNDFFSTGRIGRRNALPDILSTACATTSTADLAGKFDALTTTDVVMQSTCLPTAESTSSACPIQTTSDICSSSSSNCNDTNLNPT